METERVWGVERTWPDGHTEIQEYGSRKVAEDQAAPCIGDPWTSEVVYQDVQRTDWRKVPGIEIHSDSSGTWTKLTVRDH